MLVHRRVTPSIKFAGSHLYTWVERGTVRVKCLAKEHNTMSRLDPGPLDPESNSLTMRPSRLSAVWSYTMIPVSWCAFYVGKTDQTGQTGKTDITKKKIDNSPTTWWCHKQVHGHMENGNKVGQREVHGGHCSHENREKYKCCTLEHVMASQGHVIRDCVTWVPWWKTKIDSQVG